MAQVLSDWTGKPTLEFGLSWSLLSTAGLPLSQKGLSPSLPSQPLERLSEIVSLSSSSPLQTLFPFLESHLILEKRQPQALTYTDTKLSNEKESQTKP